MYSIMKLIKIQVEISVFFPKAFIYYYEVFNMGQKGLDFKHKEVINVNDGKRLGFVQDVTADLETGVITSIIVPRK